MNDGSKGPHRLDYNSTRSPRYYGWFWLNCYVVEVQ